MDAQEKKLTYYENAMIILDFYLHTSRIAFRINQQKENVFSTVLKNSLYYYSSPCGVIKVGPFRCHLGLFKNMFCGCKDLLCFQCISNKRKYF